MSSERIVNDDSDYEEKEAVASMVDENNENEDDDGFNLKALLNAIIISELNEKQQIRQLEDNAKFLIENEEIGCNTVNDFSKELHNVLAGYNVEKAAINDISDALSRHVYGIDWPIETSFGDMIRNALASYINEDKMALRFDVWGNGCCAFVEKN